MTRWSFAAMTAGWLTGCALVAGAQVPGRELASTSGTVQIRLEAEGSSGADPEGRLQADVQQWTASLGRVKPGTSPQTKRGAASTAVAWTVQFANDPGYLHAFITTDAGSAVCHVRAHSDFKTLFTLRSSLERCGTELKEQQNSNTASATAPATTQGQPRTPARAGAQAATAPARPGALPKPASASEPPAHPENWKDVAEVLFRSSYTGGVGGMLVIDYEPLVLFRDGTYFEAYEAALEDLDLARERQAHPVHFGTWQQGGGTYILTDNKGRPHDYKLQDGNLFRAFDAETGGALSGKYKRVSGGGNAALGGELSIMVSSRMSFSPDGRFSDARDVGMVGSGDTSGVSMAGGSSKRGGVGTYTLRHHTLELHFPDGRSERRFFAYGSAHTPATLDRDMIFIGDSPFVTD